MSTYFVNGDNGKRVTGLFPLLKQNQRSKSFCLSFGNPLLIFQAACTVDFYPLRDIVGMHLVQHP